LNIKQFKASNNKKKQGAGKQKTQNESEKKVAKGFFQLL